MPEKSAVDSEREGHLVVAGAGQPALDHGAHLVGRALPDRPGDHAGLAEAAAPRAATEDLDVEPVVHDLGDRHQLVLRVREVGQVGHRALLDLGGHVRVAGGDRHEGRALVGALVHGGHVDAGDVGELPQHVLPAAVGAPRRLPPREDLGDLADDLLAVTQHDEVEEVGDGLGVVGAVATGRDERVLGAAVSRPHGHTGQVDHVEQVRVGQLGREVEPDDVEVGGGPVGVEREQGQAAGAQQLVEVDPRGVGALRHRIGSFVQDLVEDLQALVGQADLVGVGIREQPRHVLRCVVGPLRTVFQTDVAGGFGDLGQQGFQLGPQTVHPGEWYRLAG